MGKEADGTDDDRVDGDDRVIGPREYDGAVVTVGPEDDWSETVGDEDDPVEDALVYVLPGEHEVDRRTLIAGQATFVGVGDATLTKTDVHQSPLAADATAGDATIEVEDASAFEVGRGIHVSTPGVLDAVGRESHHTHVTAIDGDELHLNEPVADRGEAFHVEDGAVCAQTHPLLATRVTDTDSERIHVRNLGFDGGGRDADAPADFTTACVYTFGDVGGSVRDCRVVDHHSEGISDQAGECRSLRNNVVEGCAYHGVHVGIDSEGTEVAHNRIEDCGGTGIYTSDALTHVTIHDNVIVDCAADPPAHVPESYDSNAAGIGDLDAGGVGDNDDNTVTNNRIELTGVADVMGVEVTGTEGNWIEDNRIVLASGSGVLCADTSDVTIDENDVEIRDGGPGDYCVELRDENDGVLLTGNRLRTNAGSAAAIRLVGDGVSIRDNVLAAPGGYPIVHENDEPRSHVQIEGNRVERGRGLVRSTAGTERDWTVADNLLTDGRDVADLNEPVRVTIDGWGTNDGDPARTGQWHGEGREGVQVRDVANGEHYVYLGGSWEAL